jgi:uncharacterized protein (TIGR02611 family)
MSTGPYGEKVDGTVQIRRIAAVRARIRASAGGRMAWRIGVTIVGVAVVAGGIVLLPLPGPGWLVIFAGLGILATEYEWAARLLGWVRDQVRTWTQWGSRQPWWLRVLAGLLTLLVILGCAAGAWLLVR